jgi:hypothetical protein
MQAQNLRLELGWEKPEEEGGREWGDGEGKVEEEKRGCSKKETEGKEDQDKGDKRREGKIIRRKM